MKRVFLVGPMGAGKTTIGRQLAKALNRQFFDSDHEIEKKTGVDIPLIFELEGEQGFRERETQIIDEMTQLDNIVLATGGGAVLAQGNREHLGQRGTVIYLYAPAESLFERTGRDKNRPLLQTDNPRQVLQDLLDQRDPLYRQVAHIIVDTTKKDVRGLVKQLTSELKQYENPNS